MLRKIITGGQSGVERAAGDVAAKLGLTHSPAASNAAAPENPSDPETSNLHRLAALSESTGIESTLRTAGGTLVLTFGELNRELERIHALVQKHRRPWLHIDFRTTPAFQASTLIGDWITQHSVETLYVTGSDSQVNQKMYEKTYHVLTSAYWLIQGHMKPVGSRSAFSHLADTERASRFRSPADVAEAVDRLAAEMSLKDRTTLSNMTENELYTLNFTLGAYIRNNFGIWTGNTALMNSCRQVSENPNLHEKDASSIIIRELWKHLKHTHKLRVIK